MPCVDGCFARAHAQTQTDWLTWAHGAHDFSLAAARDKNDAELGRPTISSEPRFERGTVRSPLCSKISRRRGPVSLGSGPLSTVSNVSPTFGFHTGQRLRDAARARGREPRVGLPRADDVAPRPRPGARRVRTRASCPGTERAGPTSTRRARSVLAAALVSLLGIVLGVDFVLLGAFVAVMLRVRRNRVQLYFNMSWTTVSGSETLTISRSRAENGSVNVSADLRRMVPR